MVTQSPQRALSAFCLKHSLTWVYDIPALQPYQQLISVFLFSFFIRYERVTDDKDGVDPAEGRTETACVAQYQSTTLRILTHFVADISERRGAMEEDVLGQQTFLLGTDWQVDVTQLVKESLRVEDPKVAQLLYDQVVIGLSTGNTKLQVVFMYILLQFLKQKLYCMSLKRGCQDYFTMTDQWGFTRSSHRPKL